MECLAERLSLDEGKVFYETPLNERMRTMLRLEFMFAQIEHSMGGSTQWDTRHALGAFFETFSVIARNEFKSELLQELDRHHANLSRLVEIPNVDANALSKVLKNIGNTRDALLSSDIISQQSLRQNDFLNAILQRSNIPGGTCNFDLPAMHCWLEHTEPESRSGYIADWWKPLRPLRDAIALTLGLIRNSSEPRDELAPDGSFQMDLDKSSPTQLIRIGVRRAVSVFPEVSGGRHRFSVRFLEQPDPNSRAAQVRRDITFELACCVM